jgi:SAM-dependent methyltransferase
MAETVYDRHTQFYVDFVDRGREAVAARGYDHLLARIEAQLGGALAGARICDLCCGEGYVGRWLMRCGAREVVGVDLSRGLVEVAKARADSGGLSYFVEDAARLDQAPGGPFDAVVCQMALQDVADHRALFAGVRRALKPGGPFVFSLLHPCFMAPCHVTDAPPTILDDDGQPVALSVRRYATEGYWRSGGDGVRGRMGCHHHMISTYVNDLMAAGFALGAMEELLPNQGPEGWAPLEGLFAEIPTVLLIAARAAQAPA